jgi:dihydrofolate synthase/folylpolyglutamate synthase
MDYRQALDFWFAHANYEQRTPGPADLKLDRMRALLARVGNPDHGLRLIHVAGSKGKGSTSAMLAAVLQRAGYRTGLFTSPHLCAVEERFQIDGQPITPEELSCLLTDLREACTHLAGPPTFFELATAACFLHFQRRRVEAAILEVGLGGRLDSTNVCLPELAIITSISYDHVRILGERLAQIAWEKAGIVKPGHPAVSGATAPEARAIIEQVCRERQAPLWQLERDFFVRTQPARVTSTGTIRSRVEVVTPTRRWPPLEVNLLGEHQATNAAVAVAGLEILRARGWSIPDRAVTAGLREVQWPARLEIIAREPLVVLDCAHNVASARALVDTLAASFPPGPRSLVFAGSNDKDLLGMFQVLSPHFQHAYLTRYSNNPRSVSPEDLESLVRQAGQMPCSLHATPAQAWAAARRAAGPGDLVCITGSVFLAGELRPLLMA